ncbi:hypothetical protein BH23ACI1_BH23ACI1_23550 [soil metagenome]
MKALGPYWESAEALEIMTRAFSRESDETRFAIEDPLNFKVPDSLWLSKEYGPFRTSRCSCPATTPRQPG